MSNSYFKLKQFTIWQDKCAMKVCTDACLFGALAAQLPLQHNLHSAGNTPPPDNTTAITENIQCLDIGTGTGLLSLMFAQKNNTAQIDAVEINAGAARQAAENFAQSPWAGRLQVFNEDVLNFKPGKLGAEHKQYNYIFSNPPFFENDLQPADEAKNNAKHNATLNLLQLLAFVDKHLIAHGYFAVLLPHHRVTYFIQKATKSGFYLYRQLLIKQTLQHKFFRGILFFSRIKNEPQLSEIVIKDLQQNYTPEFTAALKDYYLFL